MSWFSKLTDGLKKSSTKMSASLTSLFTSKTLDAASLEELEDALIEADMGPKTAMAIAEELSAMKFEKDSSQEAWRIALGQILVTRLTDVAQPLAIKGENSPHVILLVGVNGSGKTTTAGKLASHFKVQGKSVMLAAGDTFRAAATEQLQGWGQRTDTEVVTGQEGSDSAAVAYQAMQRATDAGVDVLIIDTAGRLQNRSELMDELAKIHRVIGKYDESAPHDSVIVLDGTVGQNALSQTKAFSEVAQLTGMIITKLDGSAKGGVVLALADEFGLPVHMVGVGEQVDDLQSFTAQEFAAALVGVSQEAWRIALGQILVTRLTDVAQPLAIKGENNPHVILLVGVNGSGKTTTAGKLASHFKAQGKSVMFAAGDTFRAAATEQLQGWGQRTDTEVVTGQEGSDSAAVAYQAMQRATDAGVDVLIIDTAGRLQNRSELMDELAKIHRVIGKYDESAPHDSVIVLDGTVGQNALSQTKAFSEVAQLTGMIITKLDGSAKGGVVLALADDFGLPVHMVGVGEQVDDLQSFTAQEFAAALVGVSQEALTQE